MGEDDVKLVHGGIVVTRWLDDKMSSWSTAVDTIKQGSYRYAVEIARLCSGHLGQFHSSAHMSVKQIRRQCFCANMHVAAFASESRDYSVRLAAIQRCGYMGTVDSRCILFTTYRSIQYRSIQQSVRHLLDNIGGNRCIKLTLLTVSPAHHRLH